MSNTHPCMDDWIVEVEPGKFRSKIGDAIAHFQDGYEQALIDFGFVKGTRKATPEFIQHFEDQRQRIARNE